MSHVCRRSKQQLQVNSLKTDHTERMSEFILPFQFKLPNFITANHNHHHHMSTSVISFYDHQLNFFPHLFFILFLTISTARK